MSFEILVSTMKQKDYSLLNKMNIKSNAVIINQTDFDKKNKLNYLNKNVLWLDSSEIGLSKSRNMAVSESSEKINLVADDDLIYLDSVEDIIKKEFDKNPLADIITFQVEKVDGKYKDYYPKARKLNFITSMKVSSVEMAFRNKKIKDKVHFDENFGAGSKYMMGEENIFLYDCLKKGLKIFYVPKLIGYLNNERESSWFEGYNKKFFFNKAAMYTRMSKFFSIFFIIQFAVRKKHLYSKKYSFFTILKEMFKGRREFLNTSK